MLRITYAELDLNESYCVWVSQQIFVNCVWGACLVLSRWTRDSSTQSNAMQAFRQAWKARLPYSLHIKAFVN